MKEEPRSGFRLRLSKASQPIKYDEMYPILVTLLDARKEVADELNFKYSDETYRTNVEDVFHFYEDRIKKLLNL